MSPTSDLKDREVYVVMSGSRKVLGYVYAHTPEEIVVELKRKGYPTYWVENISIYERLGDIPEYKSIERELKGAERADACE